MTNKENEHSTTDHHRLSDNHYVPGQLPPRSVKHGRKQEQNNDYTNNLDDNKEWEDTESVEVTEENMDEESGNANKKKHFKFPFIQIMLYTFLAFILTIIIYWAWENTMMKDFFIAGYETSSEQEEETNIFINNGSNGESDESDTGNIDDDFNNNSEQLEAPQQRDEDEADKRHHNQKEEDGTTSNGTSGESRDEKEQQNRSNSNEQKESEKESKKESEKNNEQDDVKVIAVHTVQEGENLFRITMKYYGSNEHQDYIAQFNNINDPSTDVKVGMQIKIPEKPQ